MAKSNRVAPVRVFDSDFKLLAEIDDYESMTWTRRWHRPGGFELHIAVSKNHTDKLSKGNVIKLGNNAAFIMHREISVAADGKEVITVKGPTLASVVGRRITMPPEGKAHDRINANIETIMKSYVASNCVAPENPSRAIPMLTIGADLGRGAKVVYQTRYRKLDEELEKLSIVSGLGWDVGLENGGMKFEVHDARDLTAGQTQNPPVIFSVDFDNIQSQSFVDSDLGYRNVGYVGGQGEGVNRALAMVGEDTSGLDRFEVFIDARDIENDSDLPTRGRQKLDELQRVVTFDSEILTSGPLSYGRDWDLGDVVTVQNRKWGITLDAKITEVVEIYEPGGIRLRAVFGSNTSTLTDKIKQALDIPLIEKTDVEDLNVPTKTSQLENDSGYITNDDIPQAATYTHSQITPADTWTINHDLGKYPSVTIVDSARNTVIGSVRYVSTDIVELTFTTSFAGKAYLN